MNKALVVIDMQTNFLKECAAENILPAVVEKIKKRTAEGYELFITLDRAGGERDERLKAVCKQGRIYYKHTYGCEELILDLKAKNPDTVEFVGVCTDICVITNLLGAMAFLPFSQFVADGGCCASPTGLHGAALSVMKSCNVKII